MSKTLFSIIFAVMLIQSGLIITYAQTPEQIAQRTKESTVLLEMRDVMGRSTQGSGFFVGEGLVATNYHVINGAKTGTVKLVDRQRR